MAWMKFSCLVCLTVCALARFTTAYVKGYESATYQGPGSQFSTEELCRDCVMNHGVGYAPYPGRCRSYVQCKFYGDVPTESDVKQCSSGLFWNQKQLICDWPSNVDCTEADNCPEQRPMAGDLSSYQVFNGYQKGWQIVSCPAGYRYNEYDCDCTDKIWTVPNQVVCSIDYFKPAEDSNNAYYQKTVGGWVRMPCPATLVFNPVTCTCVRGAEEETPGYGNDKECRPHLQILFEGAVRDSSKNKFWVNSTRVQVESGYGIFTGRSRIIVPGLSNKDFQQTLHVRVRFQQQSANALQTIVANGDCEVRPSVSMCSDSQKLQTTVETTKQASNTLTIQNYMDNQWQDVTFTMSQGSALLQGNPGDRFDSVDIAGSIVQKPRGLNIGGGGSCEGFTGLIDKVEVFTDCLPDTP